MVTTQSKCLMGYVKNLTDVLALVYASTLGDPMTLIMATFSTMTTYNIQQSAKVILLSVNVLNAIMLNVTVSV